MVFKLVMAAAKTWRRLKGENQLPKVIQGVTFSNGVEVTDTPKQTAASLTPPSPSFGHSPLLATAAKAPSPSPEPNFDLFPQSLSKREKMSVKFCLKTMATPLLLCLPAPLAAQHTMVMHSQEASSYSSCTDDWKRPIDLFPSDLIGNLYHRVSTTNPKAQQYFNQGLTFYYGFDVVSSMQSFHEATEADPKLAMGYWGVALAAGGDLNIPIEDPCMKLAIDQSKLAQEFAPSASPAEQLYVHAITVRYATDILETPRNRDPAQLSVPYMLAMRDLYDKLFTQEATKTDGKPDPEAPSLYAVSLMNLRPWAWWTAAGQPSREIDDALAALRAGLARLPDHLGLNHYYIHALEEAPIPQPSDALSSANLLFKSAPERTPHLRHMPAHTYLLSGDWEKVVQANTHAVEADDWWNERCTPEVSRPTCNPLLIGHYRSHDLLFLSVGLSNQGHWDEVRYRAEQTEDNARKFIRNQPGLEHYLTTRVMMAVRFGQWNYLTEIPFPDSAELPHPLGSHSCSQLHLKLADAIWYFGHTLVDAQQGKSTQDDLFAFNKAISCLADQDPGWGNNTASAILGVVHERLLSRIALREKRMDDAIWHATLAVEKEDALNYDEPPGWYAYSRETLGAALLLADRCTEALTVFQENLARHPNDSWSLFGIWQANERCNPGKAPVAEKQFRAQWHEPTLPSLDSM